MQRKPYMRKDDLLREVIISKGKGKRTKNLDDMLISLAKHIDYRMRMHTPQRYRYDANAHAVAHLFSRWNKFDPKKYDNPFTYYTEVYKRAYAGAINVLNWKKESFNPVDITMITFGDFQAQI